MLIRIGYDIELGLTGPTALVTLLRVHPDREADLTAPERPTIVPGLHVDRYTDLYGNTCERYQVPASVTRVRLQHSATVRDTGQPDPVVPDAVQHPVDQLPPDTLLYLLASRYCEVDSELMTFAWDTFGATAPGWPRVQAVCDWVHGHLRFDYLQADATRTAVGGFRDGVGVCRDFTHLAVTLCRCLNIPARYATGYLGDIGVPVDPQPMDFSAWFEVYLGDRWYTFDARHNAPRTGRVVMARGRDAADVPITMAFGPSTLERFEVVTDEVG